MEMHNDLILEAVTLAARDAPYAVVLTDAQLEGTGPHVLFVNPAFEAMSGYCAEEMLGGSPRRLQGKLTSALARTYLRHALRRGQPHKTVLINYRKSGEPYRCAIEVSPLRDAAGEIRYFMAIEREAPAQRGRRRRSQAVEAY